MGYVPESELPGLIAGSCALVYPSLYEGFGIPIAQAMAAGCPVIASGVSSIPEVVGDAGVLVDPRSPADIAQAIRRISDSPLARAKLIGLGRERAQMFTWQKACSSSLEFFSALAGGGPR
jgi:alpha-1,3-rhamnosyl/mannosyltransferase